MEMEWHGMGGNGMERNGNGGKRVRFFGMYLYCSLVCNQAEGYV